MKLLITGGTGLIGRAITTKLLTRTDYHITVLTRNMAQAKTQLSAKVKLIGTIDNATIEQQDIIINLAGEPIADKRWTSTQKQTICDSRWNLTEKLTQLIQVAKSPPHLFISGSAIGIYGRQQTPNIGEEFTGYHTEFSHIVCAKWEQLALNAKSNKTRVCILRTGIVLSTASGALKKMLLPFKLGLGGKIASGEQIMSWIHIDDMVNAILFIIDNHALHGAINCTAPNPVSNRAFSRALASQLSRPCLMPMPKLAARLLFGEMADLLLYGQHVVPKKLLAQDFQFKYPTLTAAMSDLIQDQRMVK